MFGLINVVGVEFLINLGGLGQLINDLAERYDLPGTWAAIVLRGAGQRRLLHRAGRVRAMAAAALVTTGTAPPRIAVAAWLLLAAWQALALSGLAVPDVVPPLQARASAALRACWPSRDFYANAASPAASCWSQSGRRAALRVCCAGLALGRQPVPRRRRSSAG